MQKGQRVSTSTSPTRKLSQYNPFLGSVAAWNLLIFSANQTISFYLIAILECLYSNIWCSPLPFTWALWFSGFWAKPWSFFDILLCLFSGCSLNDESLLFLSNRHFGWRAPIAATQRQVSSFTFSLSKPGFCLSFSRCSCTRFADDFLPFNFVNDSDSSKTELEFSFYFNILN